jgi:hypothetical protein
MRLFKINDARLLRLWKRFQETLLHWASHPPPPPPPYYTEPTYWIIPSSVHIPDEVGALKEFRQERKEYLHKKNETIKKKGSGREQQVTEFLESVCFIQ